MALFTKKDLLWATVSALISVILSVTVEPALRDYTDDLWLSQVPDDPVVVVIEEPVTGPIVEPVVEPVTGPPEECPPHCTIGPIDVDGMRAERVKAEGPGGERAWMDIAILDREHYWPINRADIIMTPGDREEDVFAFLNSSGLQKSVERATDIIAIGMASCEIAGIQDREHERALSRADQLVSWVRGIADVSGGRKLYSINLGRFRDPNCSSKTSEQTRNQRNVMLVAVLEKTTNINSPEKLSRLLRKHLYENNYLEVPIVNYALNEFHLRPHS